MKAALLLLASGCLGRPEPHGVLPGGGDASADAVSDGDNACDPSPNCPWSCPVPIMLDGLQSTDAVTSPWMYDDHSTLLYTFLPNGDPSSARIVQAARVSPDTYGPPTVLLQGSNHSYDNPAVFGTTLFFDDASGANRIITEAQVGNLQSQIQHLELGMMSREPAALPGGLVLYYYNATSQLIMRATRSAIGSSFSTIVPLARNDGSMDLIESPTTVDDTTVYVTSHVGGGEMLLAMTRAGGPFTASANVGTFQHVGANYFDPSLSLDKKTLAFASNLAGGQARLYYLHRDCVP